MSGCTGTSFDPPSVDVEDIAEGVVSDEPIKVKGCDDTGSGDEDSGAGSDTGIGLSGAAGVDSCDGGSVGVGAGGDSVLTVEISDEFGGGSTVVIVGSGMAFVAFGVHVVPPVSHGGVAVMGSLTWGGGGVVVTWAVPVPTAPL